MNDSNHFHGEVRRASAPKPRVLRDGSTALSISLNIVPDGHWGRLFDQQQSVLPSSARATISRPNHPAHPGLATVGSGIHWDTDDLNGLSGDDALKALRASTEQVDALILETNRRYLEDFVPGELAKAAAQAERKVARDTRQKELCGLADRLTPPGGEEGGLVPEDPRGDRPRW